MFVCWLALPLLVWASTAFADDAAYRQSIEKWRNDHQAELTSDTGWLTVSGLFWLHEGENRFDSDASNDIVLPASAHRAQARLNSTPARPSRTSIPELPFC
jgi:hypothetical protein